MKRIVRVAALAGLATAICLAQNDEFILKAMKDEMQRSKTLHLPGLEPPYYAEYTIEDAELFAVSATLGAVLSESHSPLRIQTVRVRVGDPNFDNTDYVFSDFFGGARYDTEQLPLETNYLGLRHILWLATDRSYKAAEESIARKRSALKDVTLPDRLPDFTKIQPVQVLRPVPRIRVNDDEWRKTTVDLSAVFAGFPEVESSAVEFQSVQSADYLLTSEGTITRLPDNVAFFRIRASGQAGDGYVVRDADVIQAWDVTKLPPMAELRRAAAKVAENVTAMAHAPQGYAYDGPVLFEGAAAAQLFGQLLGDNLKVDRRPVSEPGRSIPFLESELESRIGSRILPEWMDVVDDPTQTDYEHQALLGHYEYDLQGVAPKPLTLVDHGVLKDVLRTRTPVIKGLEGSNGHARFPGSYGTYAPGFGNLFIRATQTAPEAAMKSKLIEMCKQRNKPYCLVVRKLDWPSSASLGELRRELAGGTGGGRPVVAPLLIYRLYPDGKEELVRGLRFRGVSTRSLRDIVAASDRPYVFNLMDSHVLFALMGAGSYISNATVIAPSVLFDEMELEQVMDEVPKPPTVPPPTLTLSK